LLGAQSAINTPSVPNSRGFLVVLLLLIATIALGAPAAASIAHGVDHVAAPVSAGEHHHHAAKGSVDVHPESVPDGEGSDRSDTGALAHSHPPVPGAEPAMLGSLERPLPRRAAMVPQEWAVRALKTLSWSPQRRPPRAA